MVEEEVAPEAGGVRPGLVHVSHILVLVRAISCRSHTIHFTAGKTHCKSVRSDGEASLVCLQQVCSYRRPSVALYRWTNDWHVTYVHWWIIFLEKTYI